MINLTLHQDRGKINADKTIFDRIISEFTTPNPAHRFSKYAESTLKSISLFGTFEVGLTYDVIKVIKTIYPNEEIIIDKELSDIFRPINITSDIIVPTNIDYSYRDYQQRAIEMSLKYGRGIALLPTAAGKSLIVYGILKNLIEKKVIKNSVILVPNLQLVTQMRDDLIKYGLRESQISTFSSFSPELQNTEVIITNRQWLEKFTSKEINKRKRKNTDLRKTKTIIVNMNLTEFSKYINDKKYKHPKKYLNCLNEKDYSFDKVKNIFVKDITKKIDNNVKRIQNIGNYIDKLYDFDCLIVDEVHGITSKNIISNFVKQSKTNIRFGLTGTMPESIYENWHIKGIIGPILHTEKVYKLQEQKYIADINIINILFKHNHVPKFVDYKIKYSNPALYKEQCEKAFYHEWQYIESYLPSNQKIATLASKLQGNTLLLFDHIEHGNILFNLINSQNKHFIDGSVELDDRNDIKKIMENNTNIILAGNVKCVGTGISIKNIDNIIFAISGKGVTKIIQALGRGLRLREGKTKCNLFDIHHNFYYSNKHSDTRKELYQEFYQKSNFNEKIININ